MPNASNQELFVLEHALPVLTAETPPVRDETIALPSRVNGALQKHFTSLDDVAHDLRSEVLWAFRPTAFQCHAFVE